MASPIVVLNDGPYRDTIISRGDYYIHLFASEVTIDPDTPGVTPEPYSLRINFDYYLGVLGGAISGNSLPDWPPLPVRSPALLVPGRLMLDRWTLDASLEFLQPDYDPTSGGTNIYSLVHGTSPSSAYNLNDFTSAGDMAYIGYATSDLTVFGYMQIERVTKVDWKLVGYAFDPSGTGIVVQELVIPTPPALGILASPLAIRPKRRK